MARIEKPLAQVREWKEKISKTTQQMSTKQVIKYFNSVTTDPRISSFLRIVN